MSQAQLPTVVIDGLRRRGLIALGVAGIFSTVATFSLLVFLVPRYVSSKAKAQSENWKSASLLLIINLLIADMLQALAWGMMSWYWITQDTISAATRACLLQGFLINWADLASAFFVFAIALGTWWTLWMQKAINYNKLQFMICVIWLFPLFISLAGPLTMSEYFTPVQSGAWCWVNENYKMERLVYHYLWLFIVEGSLILIYGCIFIHLRKLRRQVAHLAHNPNAAVSPKKITRLAAFVLMYPTAFVIGTFPLSAGRMITYTHPELLARQYWIGAAVCICSCGLIDSILYAATRRSAFKGQRSDDEQPKPSSVAITTPRHGSVSTTDSAPLHPTNEPDSPYSMPNDTTGSLNTNTPLTRPANFSSPSPSVYSNNRQQYSDSGYLSPAAKSKPTLSLVTDLDAGCPGYGYPPSQASGIHLAEMKKEMR